MPNKKIIAIETIAKYFHLPIDEVAKKLGVCATVLKKTCRRHGITRWPHRKVKSIENVLSVLDGKLNGASGVEKDHLAAEIASLKRKKESILLSAKSFGKVDQNGVYKTFEGFDTSDIGSGSDEKEQTPSPTESGNDLEGVCAPQANIVPNVDSAFGIWQHGNPDHNLQPVNTYVRPPAFAMPARHMRRNSAPTLTMIGSHAAWKQMNFNFGNCDSESNPNTTRSSPTAAASPISLNHVLDWSSNSYAISEPTQSPVSEKKRNRAGGRRWSFDTGVPNSQPSPPELPPSHNLSRARTSTPPAGPQKSLNLYSRVSPDPTQAPDSILFQNPAHAHRQSNSSAVPVAAGPSMRRGRRCSEPTLSFSAILATQSDNFPGLPALDLMTAARKLPSRTTSPRNFKLHSCSGHNASRCGLPPPLDTLPELSLESDYGFDEAFATKRMKVPPRLCPMEPRTWTSLDNVELTTV